MPAVDEKTDQLIAAIDKIIQESRESVLVSINEIQNYFEKKYKCNIKSILRGNRYEIAAGQYVDVPECNIKITYASGDLQVLDFLSQIHILGRTLSTLDSQVKSLPVDARGIVDTAVVAYNQVKFLMKNCGSELQSMGDVGKIENSLMVIYTNMLSIQDLAKNIAY